MRGLRSDILTGSMEEVPRLNREFECQHDCVIRKLLDNETIAVLQRRLATAFFEPCSHGDLGEELITEDPVLRSILHFLTNLPPFLETIRRITGVADITCFAGRIYRMLPLPEHWDEWHNDVGGGRLVGMSLNLTPELYSGGIFMLRRRESRELILEVANTGLGDANLFRISPALQHHVTAVTGTVPKTAFAGWFYGDHPNLLTQARTVTQG